MTVSQNPLVAGSQGGGTALSGDVNLDDTLIRHDRSELMDELDQQRSLNVTGVPPGFIQQVKTAFRNKGLDPENIPTDEWQSIVDTLWNHTNGIFSDATSGYYFSDPLPTGNQSHIDSLLFSVKSPYPDLAKNALQLLPPITLSTEQQNFLQGNIRDNQVPLPFNPAYFKVSGFKFGDPSPSTFGDGKAGYAGGIHLGTDYGLPSGTALIAPFRGVAHVEHGTVGYGEKVTLTFANGWKMVLGHLTSTQVQDGQEVDPGTLLAFSGNSGTSYGAHLLMEMINPAGQYVDPDPIMHAIFNGTTFAGLESATGMNGLIGGRIASQSDILKSYGYDAMVDDLYSPVKSALESYLGRRPTADEIMQVARMGLSGPALSEYFKQLPSHIAGVSQGAYDLTRQAADSEYNTLFGHPANDAIIKDLFDKGVTTPSAMKLYLGNLPFLPGKDIPADTYNVIQQASSAWMAGVWNDQAHWQDMMNIYKIGGSPQAPPANSDVAAAAAAAAVPGPDTSADSPAVQNAPPGDSAGIEPPSGSRSRSFS